METGTRSTGLYYSLRNSGLLAACLYGVGQGHAIQLPPKQRLSLDSTSFFFLFFYHEAQIPRSVKAATFAMQNGWTVDAGRGCETCGCII